MTAVAICAPVLVFGFSVFKFWMIATNNVGLPEAADRGDDRKENAAEVARRSVRRKQFARFAVADARNLSSDQ